MTLAILLTIKKGFTLKWVATINACTQVCGLKWLGCHAGCHEVSMYHAKGKSEESTAHRQWRMQARGSTLDLKPRADISRSPIERYQWPQKKDWCPPIFFKKKRKQSSIKTSINETCGHTDFSPFRPYVSAVPFLRLRISPQQPWFY